MNREVDFPMGLIPPIAGETSAMSRQKGHASGRGMSVGQKGHAREEQELQIAFFEWAKWQERRYPELRLMYHVPNGGHRSKAEAGIFKAMGVKRGVPDVFLPAPRGIYHGLYIELKSSNGVPSSDQRELLNSLQEAGYFVCVLNSLDKAISITEKYLNLPQVNMLYLLIDKYGQEIADKCMLGEWMDCEV